MRLDEVQTIIAAARATAHQVASANAALLVELDTKGATRLLSALDVCSAQIAVCIVGVLSLYESRLQSSYGWKIPFDEVESHLRAAGKTSDAELFEDYRLAVNVLKHGLGRSHTVLLSRASRLPFKVQTILGELHEEGDVCPPSDLILLSVKHLEQCCDLIEASWELIRTTIAPPPLTS